MRSSRPLYSQRICFIRDIRFIHIDINFIWTVQVIIGKNRSSTFVKRKIDIWGCELYSLSMSTISLMFAALGLSIPSSKGMSIPTSSDRSLLRTTGGY
jgi:hypothetical protein